MAILIIGMACLPAGASFNPGKPYQYLLGLTVYVPTLILMLHPQRLRLLWRQPLMPWVLALLAWSVISLSWTNAARPLDQFAHCLSIPLFLAAWWLAIGNNQGRARCLFTVSAAAYAMAAIIAFYVFAGHPPEDGRLVGFGVMANANLAAAAMGAACLWLYSWRFATHTGRIAQSAILIVLALFLLMTSTRSAWLALFAALIVGTLGLGGRHFWKYAVALALVGLIGAALEYTTLSARGWSLRPEIFLKAKTLFLAHPWLGLGLGATFRLSVGTQTMTHAHNLFSQLAIELGLPGLILWTGIWLMLGWRLWRQRHMTPGRIALSLWAFATVMVQFDLPHLIDSPRPGWLLLWLPLAMSQSIRIQSVENAA